MPHSRFKIANLLAFVVAAAAVFAGLRSGSHEWFVCIYMATFVLLVYSAIAARYRGAFWHGFAVAGWAYFILGFGPWIGSAVGQPTASAYQRTANRNLATSVVLEIVADALARGDAVSTNPSNPAAFQSIIQAAIQKKRLRQDDRYGIGHSALTLLFACAGGLVSEAVARRSTSDRPA